MGDQAESTNAVQPAIRLLYVGNHAGYFLTHRLPVMEAFRDLGYDVHVAAPIDSDELERTVADNARERIRDLGFTYHSIPIRRGGTGPVGEVRLFVNLLRLFRSLKPDVVFNATVKPVLYGGLIARLCKTRAVMSSMTGLGYLYVSNEIKARLIRVPVRLLFRVAFGHPNIRVLFQNADDRDVFIRQKLVSPDKAVLIKGSGVDLQRFRVTPMPDGAHVVVLPSRMLWDKGVGEFVEAARLLRASGSNARFLLAGAPDPDNPASIGEDQLRAWHAEGVVEWYGWQEDMSATLRQAHIVCLPSYREGIPKALIEAAASGRPIVTTDVAGCRDAVVDGETGLLVPVRDARALAGALHKLLSDEQMQRDMGLKGRALAEREFSIETISSQTISTCLELIR